MGLDIHAASHLRFVRPMPDAEEFDRIEAELDDESIEDRYFLVHPNEAGQEAHLAGMEPGMYEYTATSVQHEFRAGSYSGYNWWREQLSRCALGVPPEEVWEDPDSFAGQPFVELVNFTDADGRIGTRLARKLAADFRNDATTAEKYAAELEGKEGEYFLSVYRDFATAFELAAQDGAVRFC